MGSSSYNYIKLEHFVPFGQEDFESGKLKLITRYKSDVKFSLKNSNVTKIKIPKNLVNLDPGCFYGCKHLQSIEVDTQNPNLRMEGSILVDIVNNRPIAILGGDIPEGITRIDSGLITGTAESVTIPASVTYIAPDAFIGFKGNIIVDENNETYWSYGNIIFLKADNSVWTFGYNITWPSTLTSIPNYAFRNYIKSGRRYVRPSIETAIIEEGVTNIGDYAFQNCSNLTSVNIPSSITDIGRGAFIFNDNVSVNLNKINITSIESWCNINYSSNPLYYGASLYLNGQKITNLVIPNTVTKINARAFINCNLITSVTISNSVEEIENAAFDSCTNLTSINIGSGLAIVDNNAFTGCSNILTVTVSNENTNFYTGVNGLVRKNNNMVIISGLNFTTPNDPNFTQIGFPELQYNPVKSNLTLSPSVKRIYGNNSGSLSYRIQSITLNNTLEEIGDYTFSGGTLIENITIPNTVTRIGNYAFMNLTNLTSITIPNSVTIIEDSAFYNCTKLTSITIPNSVTKIGNSAFYGCSAISEVNIDSLEHWLNIDFGNTSATPFTESNTETPTSFKINGTEITTLTIPNSITKIKDRSLYNLKGSSVTNIIVPNSVKEVGAYALNKCNNVDIDISNLEQISDYAFWGATFTNTSIVIDNSIELLGTYQFSNSNITKLVYELDSIIPNGFCTDCANLTDVTITSEIALTQSTVDSFTAATVIKVPCNLYIAALQGVFRSKVQPITEECLQYRWVDDKEICIIPELHMRQKKQVSLNGTDWYDTGDTLILPEVLGECVESCEVELNNGAWVTSTSYGDLSDTHSNYLFYESTNHSDSSSNSMILTINGYDTFTFKVRNYSESGYDYVYVSNLDDLTGTISNAYYSNINKSSASTWYDVTFSNISTGEHLIKITYRKDGSQSSGDDKGFVAIPINQ